MTGKTGTKLFEEVYNAANKKDYRHAIYENLRQASPYLDKAKEYARELFQGEVNKKWQDGFIVETYNDIKTSANMVYDLVNELSARSEFTNKKES